MLLELENDWSAKTAVKENAGRKATWEDITDMEVPVTMDKLKFERISVTVKDKNMLAGDTWMSRGDFSLRKLGSSLDGRPVAHQIRLKDKRGKAAGKMTIIAELQPLPDLVEQAQGAAGGAAALLQSMGKLQLVECVVSGVLDTGMLGKQDLSVKMSIANWKKTTDGEMSLK